MTERWQTGTLSKAMTEPIKERNIHINFESGEIAARGYNGRIEFYGNLGKYSGYEGLSWRTWKFKDIDASEKDGALIELNPGKRTPVELVVADKVFSEVPLKGKLVFLHIDQGGKVSAYHFDSARERDSSFLFEAGRGELFCWVALGGQTTQILEYEEPGFTDSDLKLVNPGTEEISGKKIPGQFWTMIDQLERGETKNTVIPITELGSL